MKCYPGLISVSAETEEQIRFASTPPPSRAPRLSYILLPPAPLPFLSPFPNPSSIPLSKFFCLPLPLPRSRSLLGSDTPRSA